MPFVLTRTRPSPSRPWPGRGAVAFFCFFFFFHFALRVVGPSFDFSCLVFDGSFFPCYSFMLFLSETVESFVRSTFDVWCGGGECRDNVLYYYLL